MLQRFKSHGLIGLAVFVLLSLFALDRTQLSGDGGEYILMTHALSKHATPEIRASDTRDFLMQPTDESMPIPRAYFEAIGSQAGTAHPAIVSGFFPNAEGHYYAMHFWLYSLMALPFYMLLKLFGMKIVWALGLPNISFAGAALLYMRRAMPERFWTGFVLFVSMGTTFYLPWTGPEVMSASCALIAVIAMLRGDAALSILMSGLGASQNPPLMFLMPFALGWRLLLPRWPQLGWPGNVVKPLSKRDIAMAVGGVVLALVPFAFFQLTFGMPSLIGHYSTAPEMIAPSRLFSLFGDLNQGMIVGLPGLVVALALVLVLANVPRRASWLTTAGLVIASVVVMAIPTLSANNWNPGGIVMLRYNYWLGMPLLALVLLALLRMPRGRLTFVPWVAIVLQVAVMGMFGFWGKRSSYTQHTPIAKWVLSHAPERYNPDPEIFYERSAGQELGMPLDLTWVYRNDGKPAKVLRHWSNFNNSAGLCQTGAMLRGHAVQTVERGWQYLHAPFDCVPARAATELGIWPIHETDPNARTPLTAGWASIQGAGVWSDAVESTLTLQVPQGQQALSLLTTGHYYGNQRNSEVTVNGRNIGTFRLSDGRVALPSDLRKERVLTIVLRHAKASSPLSRGESPDGRTLGLYLEAIGLEMGPI